MSPEAQLKLIKRNTVEIIQERELLRRIKSKGSLKIKFGVDPTTPDIHLGHSVILLKLRCFQDLGHQVILLIGDFTARVGYPSGRIKTRRPMSSRQIMANAKTYQHQSFKILDPAKTKLRYNSEWLSRMNFSRVLRLASHYTVARMLERDDFHKRYQENYPIGLHEFMYPLMQAYDSVALKADIELGGTDQKFNLLFARQIQKSYGQPPQIVITMPILEGTDGVEKMSKSLGNYIGITESPQEMYGKIMSLPDNLVSRYFRLTTLLNDEEIGLKESRLQEGKLHPKNIKKDLAKEIVSFYHDRSSAETEEKRFETVFGKKEVPEEIPFYYLDAKRMKEGRIWIVKLLQLTGLVRSSSQARRLIEQGGVRWDGGKVQDVNLEICPAKAHILQVGKRKFVRIVKR
jgi:tyrosyl-tRNA synthetase